MNSFFNKAKYVFIIYFLLIAFIFFIPSSTAAFGDIYVCHGVIEIDYDTNLTTKPLLPIDMVLEIPLEINFFVQGYYADFVTDAYLSRSIDAFIYLEIESTPEWCDATVSPNVLIMPATIKGSSNSVNLSVKINRDAQALDAGDIVIQFDVTRMGAIQRNVITKKIPFTVGYLPILDIEIPEGTVKSISPDETATFDIEITNIGNGKTNVFLSVIDAPDGWTATIPSSIIIESKNFSDSNKRIVQLNIKPPQGIFRYHNERETITVAVKPSFFKDDAVEGEEYYLIFLIKNKGFSTPGFEVLYIVIGLIVVILIVKRKNSYYKGGKDT